MKKIMCFLFCSKVLVHLPIGTKNFWTFFMHKIFFYFVAEKTIWNVKCFLFIYFWKRKNKKN